MKNRPILFSGPMVRAMLDGRKTQTRRVVKDQSTVRDAKHGPEFWTGFMGWQDAASVLHDQSISTSKATRCPYGQPGDLLYVRESMTYWERPDSKENQTPKRNESHRPRDGARYERWMNRVSAIELSGEDFIVYKADDTRRSIGEWEYPHPIYEHCVGRFGKTVTGIHMPRWASRLTLEITDVRVQRLTEINRADAIAEGVHRGNGDMCGDFFCRAPGEGYWKRDPRDAYADLWQSINGAGSWDANPWVWAITYKVHQQNIDAYLAERGGG